MTTIRQATHRVAPGARHVEHLDGETLVYDITTDQVLRLAPDAASVWDACAASGDAGATAAALAITTELGTPQVDRALADLAANGLVECIGTDGISRRQFARKAGMGAAAVASLTLVTSMAAPSPAMAASGPGGGGGQSGGGDDCTTDCG